LAGSSSIALAEATPTSVQSVVVTAQTPQVQTLVDRKVYTVSADLQSHAGTAADVLNNVPSVEVDIDGGISLRGDHNVVVLVDGKPSANLTGAAAGLGLQQFSANEIDRVEVMTNPPAQYKVDGSGGVINIITKRSRNPGLSGSVQASLGDKRRFVTGASLSYSVGALKLNGSVGLKQEFKQRIVSLQRTTTDAASATPVFSTQHMDENLPRLTPSGKLGASYDLSPRQTLSAQISHSELTGDRYFDQHNTSASAGAFSSITDRHSQGYEWSVSEAASLRLDQKLWREGETLSAALQRSVTRERERYFYTNRHTLPASSPTYDHLYLSLDIETIEFSLDYVLPLAAERSLKLGYDFENDLNGFDHRGDTLDPVSGAPVPNPLITNDFRYHQKIHAAYATYDDHFGKWSLQGGLRLEQADTDALQLNGALASAHSYFRAYPSLHLERELSEQAHLSFSASRRVTRPDPESLNPFIDSQDVHNLRAGNADLLPQDTWSYEAGYGFDSKGLRYGLTGYYRFNRDSVTDIVRVISADTVLATKSNLPVIKSGGVEFTAGGKLGAKLNYSLSGNLFYSQLNSAALGTGGARDTSGLNLKASLDYRPSTVDTLQISANRSDRRLTPQGSIGAINVVNLGYKRQLAPSLSLIGTVSDLFEGQNTRRNLQTSTLEDRYQRQQRGRILYLGVSYSFGGGKKAKPASFDYDQ
jgi:outer membrane receptor for ferrienterochelin and colicin